MILVRPAVLFDMPFVLTQNDDVRCWSISEIARNTGFSRDLIREAMNLYENSRGVMGLPFMRATVSERRRARKSQVLEWMQRMERNAAHHE